MTTVRHLHYLLITSSLITIKGHLRHESSQGCTWTQDVSTVINSARLSAERSHLKHPTWKTSTPNLLWHFKPIKNPIKLTWSFLEPIRKRSCGSGLCTRSGHIRAQNFVLRGPRFESDLPCIHFYVLQKGKTPTNKRTKDDVQFYINAFMIYKDRMLNMFMLNASHFMWGYTVACLQSSDPDIQHWTWGTEECTGLFSPYNVTNIAVASELSTCLPARWTFVSQHTKVLMLAGILMQHLVRMTVNNLQTPKAFSYCIICSSRRSKRKNMK